MIDLSAIPAYDDRNYRQLMRPVPTENGLPQALPRRTRYGSTEAEGHGLVPVADYPQHLIDPKDYKEIIQRCHEREIFPMYWEREAGVERWNQDGLPYCWAWGCTGALMACRANMRLSKVQLAPNSLGWLVNWRSQGYYLDGTINGARERGIAPLSAVSNIHSRSPSTFADDWEDQALNYRTGEWWDVRIGSDASVIQQCLTILADGVPLYAALMWWNHALQLVGYEWDESEPHNVMAIWWNSHDDDLIKISGSRGVPDEAYGIRTGSLPGGAGGAPGRA